MTERQRAKGFSRPIHRSKMAKVLSYINELPDSYLLWLNFTADVSDCSLALEIKAEVADRFPDRLPERLVSYPVRDDSPLSLENIKAIYPQMALAFHPDRGGNLEAMKAINLFYQKLVEVAA